MDSSQQMEALVICALTLLVLGVGRLPGLRIDRTGAAVIGAGLMLAIGAMNIAEAWAAIHAETILLLFGMMIVVANLRLSGFFNLTGNWVVRKTHGPLALLAGVLVVNAVLSALFVNDTMCLVMTPLVLEVTTALRRNPMPYLIGVAVSSNIGSVATITGNPQNMMIGSYSGIPYATFLLRLAPVAVVGLVFAMAILFLLYRDEFRGRFPQDVAGQRVAVDTWLLWKSSLAAAAVFVAFLLGVPVAKAAMVAGALLLITRRVNPETIYRQIDWSLLVLFAGLFVVLASVEKTGAAQQVVASAMEWRLGNVWALSAVAAVMSNVISNVPAVMVLKPVVERLGDPATGWLALAMSSTLAGNLTLVGSIANLIVVQQARPTMEIGFWQYSRVGFPLTLVTLAAGAWWLS